MPQRHSLLQLQARLGGEIRGDGGVELEGVASLEHAGARDLSFVVSAKFADAAALSPAGALIVPAALATSIAKPLLVVANPHATFARAVALFHPEPNAAAGVDPSATIDPSAAVDANTVIGPRVVIGARSRIGPGSRIGAGTVIGDGVTIGADCRLYANVTVYPGCLIGDRVLLHSGCVIGSDGFGLAREGDSWLKVPQVGRVRIGNDVEIGANTTIDRGALDDTVIEDGAKIDNLVQVAHNCRIGANTAIAGCAGIAGSTRIGRHCLIGGAAMILGHIEIGDRVTVSGASFIGKSIREPGTYTSTQPQMPHAEWLRNAAQLRHLADMRERIRRLEKKIAELEETR